MHLKRKQRCVQWYMVYPHPKRMNIMRHHNCSCLPRLALPRVSDISLKASSNNTYIVVMLWSPELPHPISGLEGNKKNHGSFPNYVFKSYRRMAKEKNRWTNVTFLFHQKYFFFFGSIFLIAIISYKKFLTKDFYFFPSHFYSKMIRSFFQWQTQLISLWWLWQLRGVVSQLCHPPPPSSKDEDRHKIFVVSEGAKNGRSLKTSFFF